MINIPLKNSTGAGKTCQTEQVIIVANRAICAGRHLYHARARRAPAECFESVSGAGRFPAGTGGRLYHALAHNF
ncbi:hypothetical protein D8B20_13190 [Candidatus Pantoea soli]|uniref:Uncharacterized protein n=1 Tax=Candidatus Pantoea soli TaxID=3098669 RepID=A0A518XF32_9GAMM|nr:hypothetical protein D8B20_13190 [Pantoea soli]